MARRQRRSNPLTIMLWTVTVALPLVFGVHLMHGVPEQPNLLFWALCVGATLLSAGVMWPGGDATVRLSTLVAFVLFGAMLCMPLEHRVWVAAAGMIPSLFAARDALERLRKHLGHV